MKRYVQHRIEENSATFINGWKKAQLFWIGDESDMAKDVHEKQYAVS